MSLSVSSYVKHFYQGNLFGATANSRIGYYAGSLVSADTKALRQAVRDLSSYDYKNEKEDDELSKKVQAFAETYNNLVDAAGEMDSEDLERYVSKLKKMAKEQSSGLEDIGITIQSSGKLKVDKEALKNASKYAVSKLFTEDAEFSKQVDGYMGRIQNLIKRNSLDVARQMAVSKETDDDKQEEKTAGKGGTAGLGDADAQLIQKLTEALSGSQVDHKV